MNKKKDFQRQKSYYGDSLGRSVSSDTLGSFKHHTQAPKNRLVVGAISIATVGMILTGCGTPKQVSSSHISKKAKAAVQVADKSAAAVPQPSFPKYTKTVNITWWTRTPNASRVVQEFESVYPNIHVSVTDSGGNSETISKLIASEKASSGIPDLVLMPYHYFGEIKALGAVTNVAQYASRYKSYFSKWYWAQASGSNGAVYALPEDAQPEVLFYRKDLFKKAGLPYIPPRTWSQFAVDANVFHKKYPGKYFSALPTSTAAATMMFGLWQQVGAQPSQRLGHKYWLLDYTSARILKVLNFWQSLVHEGAVVAEPVLTTAWDHQMATNQFGAMVWGPWLAFEMPPAGVPYTTDHWTMALLPQWSQGQAYVTGEMGGSVNFVPRGAAHPQAATLFAGWLETSRAGLTDDALSSASGGRGMTPADIYANKLPAMQAPNPVLHGQVIGNLFTYGVNHINFKWTWNPWEEYAVSHYAVLATKAASGTITWTHAMKTLETEVATYARSEGYKIKISP